MAMGRHIFSVFYFIYSFHFFVWRGLGDGDAVVICLGWDGMDDGFSLKLYHINLRFRNKEQDWLTYQSQPTNHLTNPHTTKPS